jgi:hypothetical protein
MWWAVLEKQLEIPSKEPFGTDFLYFLRSIVYFLPDSDDNYFSNGDSLWDLVERKSVLFGKHQEAVERWREVVMELVPCVVAVVFEESAAGLLKMEEKKISSEMISNLPQWKCSFDRPLPSFKMWNLSPLPVLPPLTPSQQRVHISRFSRLFRFFPVKSPDYLKADDRVLLIRTIYVVVLMFLGVEHPFPVSFLRRDHHDGNSTMREPVEVFLNEYKSDNNSLKKFYNRFISKFASVVSLPLKGDDTRVVNACTSDDDQRDDGMSEYTHVYFSSSMMAQVAKAKGFHETATTPITPGAVVKRLSCYSPFDDEVVCLGLSFVTHAILSDTLLDLFGHHLFSLDFYRDNCDACCYCVNLLLFLFSRNNSSTIPDQYLSNFYKCITSVLINPLYDLFVSDIIPSLVHLFHHHLCTLYPLSFIPFVASSKMLSCANKSPSVLLRYVFICQSIVLISATLSKVPNLTFHQLIFSSLNIPFASSYIYDSSLGIVSKTFKTYSRKPPSMETSGAFKEVRLACIQGLFLFMINSLLTYGLSEMFSFYSSDLMKLTLEMMGDAYSADKVEPSPAEEELFILCLRYLTYLSRFGRHMIVMANGRSEDERKGDASFVLNIIETYQKVATQMVYQESIDINKKVFFLSMVLEGLVGWMENLNQFVVVSNVYHSILKTVEIIMKFAKSDLNSEVITPDKKTPASTPSDAPGGVRKQFKNFFRFGRSSSSSTQQPPPPPQQQQQQQQQNFFRFGRSSSSSTQPPPPQQQQQQQQQPSTSSNGFEAIFPRIDFDSVLKLWMNLFVDCGTSFQHLFIQSPPESLLVETAPLSPVGGVFGEVANSFSKFMKDTHDFKLNQLLMCKGLDQYLMVLCRLVLMLIVETPVEGRSGGGGDGSGGSNKPEENNISSSDLPNGFHFSLDDDTIVSVFGMTPSGVSCQSPGGVIRVVVRNIVGKRVWDITPEYYGNLVEEMKNRKPAPQPFLSASLLFQEDVMLSQTTTVNPFSPSLESLMDDMGKGLDGVNVRFPSFGHLDQIRKVGEECRMCEEGISQKTFENSLDSLARWNDPKVFKPATLPVCSPIPVGLTLMSLLGLLGVVSDDSLKDPPLAKPIQLYDIKSKGLVSSYYTINNLLHLLDVVPTRNCVHGVVFYLSRRMADGYDLSKLKPKGGKMNSDGGGGKDGGMREEDVVSASFLSFIRSLGTEVPPGLLPHLGFGFEYLRKDEKIGKGNATGDNTMSAYHNTFTDEVMFHVINFLVNNDEVVNGGGENGSNDRSSLNKKQRIVQVMSSDVRTCVVWWEGSYDFSLDKLRLIYDVWGSPEIGRDDGGCLDYEELFITLLFTYCEYVIVIIPVPSDANTPSFFQVRVIRNEIGGRNYYNNKNNNNTSDGSRTPLPLTDGLLVPPHLLAVMVISTVLDVSNTELRERGRSSVFDMYSYRMLLLRKIRELKMEGNK